MRIAVNVMLVLLTFALLLFTTAALGLNISAALRREPMTVSWWIVALSAVSYLAARETTELRMPWLRKGRP